MKAKKKRGKSIKIRKTWGNVKPFTQPHSTKKGKKGYNRKEIKKIGFE